MYKNVVSRVLGVPFGEKHQLVVELGKRGFRSTEIQEIHRKLFDSSLDRSLGKAELFNELLFSIKQYCDTVKIHERYWALPSDKSVLNLNHTVKLDQIPKRKATG